MVETLDPVAALETVVINDVLTIDELQTKINDLQITRNRETADTQHLLVRAVDLLTQMVENLQARVSSLEAERPLRTGADCVQQEN